jgi:TonB family protein
MTKFTTKIKFPKIEIKNIISESTPKKYDRRKLLSENEKGCKEEWYWYYEDPNSEQTKEYNTDQGGPTKGKYSPNLPKGCWNGKDPLSCNLRKSVGEKYGFKASPCSSVSVFGTGDYCSGAGYYNCLLGVRGNHETNPFINNPDLLRVEFFVLSPNSPNNTNIVVQVFRENKEVVDYLTKSVSSKSLVGDVYYNSGGWLGGSLEGCYVFKKNNATDSEIISLINYLNGKTTLPFTSSSNGNVSNTTKQTPVKSPEEIKKELLARPDTNIVAPRLYVESLGFKDWKQYQKDFGCPTSKENKTEHIKCNQNIATAFKDGWRPGNEIPEDKRGSKYVGLGSGKGKGDGEGDSDVDSENTDGVFGGKSYGTTPEITDIPGLEPAQFDGDMEKWFADNFTYPKEAKEKGLEAVVKVNFTITEKGEVESVESDSDVEETLKVDAINLIKKMPKWTPSKKDGVAIPTNTSIEVEYFLGFE